MKVILHSQISNISIGYNPRRQISTTQGYKSWSHGVANFSVLEVNMLKNSSTLGVFVPINLSIKFGFVSVNGPGKTCFVDVLCILTFARLGPTGSP